MTNQRLGGARNQGQNRLMNIGYARVSTEDQNPDLQLATLKKDGCKRIFIEKATGGHVRRMLYRALRERD